jgi:predicted tellurium resistance membrane protein TerC
LGGGDIHRQFLAALRGRAGQYRPVRDNAVIALAARDLAPRHRNWLLSGQPGRGRILRVLLTIVAVQMLKGSVPAVCRRTAAHMDRGQAAAEKDDPGEATRPRDVFGAIRTILIADVVASLTTLPATGVAKGTRRC